MPADRALETLTAGDFRAALATWFRLTARSPDGAPAGSFTAELADVTEHPASVPGALRNPFSLVFHGPLDPVWPQGIYRAEEERFGAVELFIVPVGPSLPAAAAEAPAAMRYEAVFG